MKKIIVIIMSICLTLLAYIYFNFKSLKTNVYSNNYFMTIVYNNINGNTYYYKYDLKTNIYKTIYVKKNNGYSEGLIGKDGNDLYFTDRDLKGKYNLYKIQIDHNSYTNKQLTENINIDEICLGDNKIFCRAKQNNHRNNSIAIFNLLDNKLKVCNEEESDSDVFNIEYNQYTHKLYTIERSIKDIDTTHLPDIPLHKIVEYDENGNKIKDLFKTKGFINHISISKDGSSALISVSENTSLDKIYIVNLNNSNKELIIESTKDYIVSHPIFSTDEKGFYFLAITPDSKILVNNGLHIEKSKGIYYYDFNTKKVSNIFNKNDGVVNEYNIQ